MNKLFLSFIISLVVISALISLESDRQSIVSANTLFNSIQQDTPPLTLSKIEQMLEHGTPDPTIASLIRQRGIAFQPTANLLAHLKKLNYSQTIQALERIRGINKKNPPKKETVKPKKTRTKTASNLDTITILVADFRGPDPQNYLVTDKIIQGLRAATNEYSDISIQPLKETITEQTGSKGGSEYARDIGAKRKASIILWGYYGATSKKVDVNVYFEVLRRPKRLALRQNFETQSLPISELTEFKIQTRLSKEMTYLVLLTVGIARYESGDYEGAINRFTKALTPFDAALDVPEQIIDPYLIYFYRGLAYCYRNGVSGLDQAIADLTEVIKLKPDLAVAYYDRGLLYGDKRQYDQAIADYDKAIRFKPDLAEPYNNRGVTYAKQGQYDRAISDYNKSIKLKPDYAYAYANRGTTYSLKGQYDKAIVDYDMTIKLRPDLAEAYNNRGNAYHGKRQYDKAIADYNKAIELKPDYVEAYYNRGNTYNDKRQYDKAIADYDATIKLKPDLVEAYYNRAIAYRNKGEMDRAITDYTEAIKLKPDYVNAYINRGNIYKATGQYDHAIADYTDAIKLNPDDAETYINRGIAYREKGEFDRAIADMRRVLQITKDPNLREHAEQLLQKLGTK